MHLISRRAVRAAALRPRAGPRGGGGGGGGGDRGGGGGAPCGPEATAAHQPGEINSVSDLPQYWPVHSGGLRV
eukprot:3269254-Rhodomonas_salina.1